MCLFQFFVEKYFFVFPTTKQLFILMKQYNRDAFYMRHDAFVSNLRRAIVDIGN